MALQALDRGLQEVRVVSTGPGRGSAGIASRRLAAQRLTGEPFATAVDAVAWMGAVQSQDYAAAKWAIGQRTAAVTDADIDELLDRGALLRTHVLRPTWHVVHPQDIRWLLALTGPRVLRSIAGRHRDLGIDGASLARASAAFAAALQGGRSLTRRELGDVLAGEGIAPDGQRLPHLLMAAELEGLIVSGPRRGRQFTWALLEERAPMATAARPSDPLAELARRYFRSHGPAQVHDFAWWSGLRLSDARAGVARAGAALAHEVIDGTDHWFDADGGPVPDADHLAHLLPNFDEYAVAYRDRRAIFAGSAPASGGLGPAGVLQNIVTVGGRVRGTWRRTSVRGVPRVEIRVADGLRASDIAAVGEACRRLARFLDADVVPDWVAPGS